MQQESKKYYISSYMDCTGKGIKIVVERRFCKKGSDFGQQTSFHIPYWKFFFKGWYYYIKGIKGEDMMEKFINL